MNKIITLVSLVFLFFGCGGGSVSVQPSQNNFDLSQSVNDKIDVLWVVDCSSSMTQEIDRVINNVNSFIEEFVDLGYDYRIGVITSSAWLQYNVDSEGGDISYLAYNKLHVGEAYSVDSTNGGLLPKFIDENNPDVTGNFSTNFDINAPNNCGDLPGGGSLVGDERPMQSVRAFLETSTDVGSFRRADAFLAVITISDERDSSRASLVVQNGQNAQGGQGAHSPQSYLDHLTNFVGSVDGYRTYTITKTSGSFDINRDYATLSGGFAIDIDGNAAAYSEGLSQITTNIIEVASQFPLDADPVVSSLQVSFTTDDGSGPVTTVVQEDNTETDGYKYFASGNYVAFFGPSRPPANAQVSIQYDRDSL